MKREISGELLFKVRVQHTGKMPAVNDSDFDKLIPCATYMAAQEQYNSLIQTNYYVDICTKMQNGCWQVIGGCYNEDYKQV